MSSQKRSHLNRSDCGIFTIKSGELLLCQIDPRNSNQYSFNPNHYRQVLGYEVLDRMPNEMEPSEVIKNQDTSSLSVDDSILFENDPEIKTRTTTTKNPFETIASNTMMKTDKENEVDLPIGKKIKLPNRARTPSKVLAAKQLSMKKAREVKP